MPVGTRVLYASSDRSSFDNGGRTCRGEGGAASHCLGFDETAGRRPRHHGAPAGPLIDRVKSLCREADSQQSHVSHDAVAEQSNGSCVGK